MQGNFFAPSNVSNLKPTLIEAEDKSYKIYDFNQEIMYDYIDRIFNINKFE